jgi:hypothetical protein
MMKAFAIKGPDGDIWAAYTGFDENDAMQLFQRTYPEDSSEITVVPVTISERGEQDADDCERDNARLREELAETKRDREEARDIHNSNMNRYAERAEQAEARALANEKDAGRYRWLRELPNADFLNLPYMGTDLDNVIDAGIAGSAT